MRKIGLIYTPIEGKAARVGWRIKEMMPGEQVDMIPSRLIDNDILADYDDLIFGISTYADSQSEIDLLNHPWENFKTQLSGMQLTRKRIALYCIGDQIGYSNSFVNELREVADIASSKGAVVVAHYPNEGYTFKASNSLINGSFYGLPLDEKNQPELTESRLKNWKTILDKAFDS